MFLHLKYRISIYLPSFLFQCIPWPLFHSVTLIAMSYISGLKVIFIQLHIHVLKVFLHHGMAHHWNQSFWVWSQMWKLIALLLYYSKKIQAGHKPTPHNIEYCSTTHRDFCVEGFVPIIPKPTQVSRCRRASCGCMSLIVMRSNLSCLIWNVCFDKWIAMIK